MGRGNFDDDDDDNKLVLCFVFWCFCLFLRFFVLGKKTRDE